MTTAVTCEACEDSGILNYSKVVEAEAYKDGKGSVLFAAACLCPAGLRRSHGAFPRIDRVFSLQDVEREYFPNGLPRQTQVEINDKEMTRLGLSHKVRGWTLDTYPDKQATQLPAARQWVVGDTHRDLVLTGPQGTGKTGMAIGMLRALHLLGRSVKFVAANEWLVQLQASFNRRPEGGESELDLLMPATFPYLLVLDDLNARRADKTSGRMSDYFADVLQLIINKRQGAEKPTILTTNLDTEELQDFLTPTLYDRLREGEFWEFTGASNRMPKPVLPFPSGGRRKAARKKR